jgi:hypothetical protein
MSTPLFQQFNPNEIEWQAEATKYYDKFDYSKGILELFFSGSVGCLREDTLIETACGKAPISSITSQDYLLSFDHSENQFVYQRGNDAFPKGKGYLYRVVHEHGEFVASGNHHISTLSGSYLPVLGLSVGSKVFSYSSGQQEKYLSCDQKWLISSVLDCLKIISNFQYHCLKYIHQYDQSLLLDQDIAQFLPPLRAGAQESGQFSFCHKLWREGDFLERELIHGHTFELPDHLSMRDLILLLEGRLFSLESRDVLSKRLRSFFLLAPSLLLVERPTKLHLHTLKQFLLALSCSLNKLLAPPRLSIKTSKIKAIEKLSEEWFWDIQVPNTNNYLSSGALHHNSAKTIEDIHLVVRHCLENPGARYLMLRRVLKDLKRTSWNVLLQHMADIPHAIKAYNKSELKITFVNGSEIIGDSYDKLDLEKFRSLELSGADFEEATECPKEVYEAVKMRVGRLPSVKKNIITSRSNPDSPGHWLYEYFIESKDPLRKVFYSLTEQNKFLPPWYVKNLKETLDPKMARRMLGGEWIDISGEGVYYNYETSRNYLDKEYVIDKSYPIFVTHDFNIGAGKPMSSAAGQFIKGIWHWFKAFHVEGARTGDIMEEMADWGLFENRNMIIVNGDATGKSRDTRNRQSDYDIIETFLSRYQRKDGSRIEFEIDVPKSNPPLRSRHNLTNSKFLDANGDVKFYTYDNWIDKGFRLTNFQKGSLLLEDDSLPEQHVTTAIAYSIFRQDMNEDRESKTVSL